MPHAKLDPARIHAEAMRLFKAHGLEALTARRLADALGVSPSSLYWHVADKRALHAMLTEDVFRGCLAAVPPAEGWEAWLRGFGLALWQAQAAMPDTRKLIMLHPLGVETAAALRAEVVGALVARGLEPGFAKLSQRSVQALVTGWTTLGDGTVAGEGEGADLFADALDALIAGWRARVDARA